MPLESCSAEKDYKCSRNEDTGKWKVQTCKLPGFIHPATGQCNCESEWVNKIKPVGVLMFDLLLKKYVIQSRRPQRDTRKIDSQENTNSRSREKRRNRKNDRRVSSRSRKSRRKMKTEKARCNRPWPRWHSRLVRLPTLSSSELTRIRPSRSEETTSLITEDILLDSLLIG